MDWPSASCLCQQRQTDHTCFPIEKPKSQKKKEKKIKNEPILMCSLTENDYLGRLVPMI